jgi:tRNA(Arg) A34 adenosine deaminase TadA
VIARQAAAKFDADLLWDCTLYTTVEPCCMCAGTQYWAGIGRLIYGMSETRLRSMTGRHPENPTLDVPCREVFSRGQKPIRVWGPIAGIEDELAEVHERFWQAR